MDTALVSKVKKKIKVTKKEAAVFAAAFALACAFGVSPITAGVYPFGLSLVIASSSKYRLPFMLGCLISFVITGVNLFLPVLILLILFFILRSADKETPCPLYLKLVLACCSAAVLAAKAGLGGIELFADVVLVVATAVSIPVFSGLFALYFEPRSVHIPRALKDCSMVAFAFAGASFFGMFEIASVPLSLAAGALFTLAAAKTRGFLFGGVCGFVCGLACSVPAIAALGINRCVHFSALWADIEPLTDAGLVALACTPSHAWVTPAGGSKPLFGTNPLAFGWPRAGQPAFIFDFATSAVARGEIELTYFEFGTLAALWRFAQANLVHDALAHLAFKLRRQFSARRLPQIRKIVGNYGRRKQQRRGRQQSCRQWKKAW